MHLLFIVYLSIICLWFRTLPRNLKHFAVISFSLRLPLKISKFAFKSVKLNGKCFTCQLLTIIRPYPYSYIVIYVFLHKKTKTLIITYIYSLTFIRLVKKIPQSEKKYKISTFLAKFILVFCNFKSITSAFVIW